MQLLWDAIGSEFGGRHELYEINYSGGRPTTFASVGRVTRLREVLQKGERQNVVHLHHPFDMDPPETDKWIVIKPESPLFEELMRQHHRQGTWGAGSL